MSTQAAAPPEKRYRPYVPENMEMKEFTFRAVLIGLFLTVILGAANAYLGLRAGMTIAATYPAAVIGMALLRLMKGSLLEENIARTVGSIGESVAAGAVFTIPAFLISGAWSSFGFRDAYWKSVALMAVGGSLGILFVTLLRRVMVEDPELPFPESVAASEIHKAGQQGAGAAKLLFANMGLGGLIYLLGAFQLFNASKAFIIHIGQIGTTMLKLGRTATAPVVSVGGVTTFQAPAISPAYLGVGYIIGPRLASLNFAGGVVAWGLLVHLIMYFLGPTLQATMAPGWKQFGAVWRTSSGRCVGGMMVARAGRCFCAQSLAIGMRSTPDLKVGGSPCSYQPTHERDRMERLFWGTGRAFLA
jgi:putative OPT family oligopeptide transporter